jgi:hypothetical protein
MAALVREARKEVSMRYLVVKEIGRNGAANHLADQGYNEIVVFVAPIESFNRSYIVNT